jgi:hypothetical protein
MSVEGMKRHTEIFNLTKPDYSDIFELEGFLKKSYFASRQIGRKGSWS